MQKKHENEEKKHKCFRFSPFIFMYSYGFFLVLYAMIQLESIVGTRDPQSTTCSLSLS